MIPIYGGQQRPTGPWTPNLLLVWDAIVTPCPLGTPPTTTNGWGGGVGLVSPCPWPALLWWGVTEWGWVTWVTPPVCPYPPYLWGYWGASSLV